MKTRRQDCVLASKVWYELDHQGVIDSVHASLKRLQTDHIDILQVHVRMYEPTEVEHVLNGGPLDALLELREAGKTGIARAIRSPNSPRLACARCSSRSSCRPSVESIETLALFLHHRSR